MTIMLEREIIVEAEADDDDLVHVICCVCRRQQCNGEFDFDFEEHTHPSDYIGPDLCIVCDNLDEEAKPCVFCGHICTDECGF